MSLEFSEPIKYLEPVLCSLYLSNECICFMPYSQQAEATPRSSSTNTASLSTHSTITLLPLGGENWVPFRTPWMDQTTLLGLIHSGYKSISSHVLRGEGLSAAYGIGISLLRCWVSHWCHTSPCCAQNHATPGLGRVILEAANQFL